MTEEEKQQLLKEFDKRFFPDEWEMEEVRMMVHMFKSYLLEKVAAAKEEGYQEALKADNLMPAFQDKLREAKREVELDFVRRIEQIDKFADSYDEYTTRVIQYATELKSKYQLSEKEEK